MKPTETKLLPCPFCGGDTGMTRYIRDGRQAFCSQCGASGAPAYNGKTDADERARASWNHRPKPTSKPMERRGGYGIDEFERTGRL